MTHTSLSTSCLLLLAALAASAADVRFTPRRSRNYDERANEGLCAIKVWVDEDVNIFLQGDTVIFETVRGQQARDVGTECSQPLPRGGSLSDFQFRGIDGRGRVELIGEPGPRNNYRAWVRIQDTRGGGEEHHFRLTWRNLWTNQSQRGGDIFSRGRRGNERFDGVCFYERPQFDGREYCAPIGDHRANVGPDWNDRFESMRIFGRTREVELFDNENFGGGSYRTRRDEPDLSRLRDSRGQRLDRRVTSFRVY